MDLGSKKISRNRPQLSCTACRRRKLKCDRGDPCDNCRRRNEQHLCTYLPPNLNQRNPKKSGKSKSRLDRLEKLVTELNAKVQQVDPSHQGYPVSLATQNDTNLSHATLGDNPQGLSVRHFTSSLWEDVLNDIAEIKDCVDDAEYDTDNELQENHQPDELSVFCFRGQTDIAMLVASLPTRVETDRLVANFFHFSYALRPIVHTEKFRSEYESFWSDPLAASASWLGMLFCMLRISSDLFIRSGVAPLSIVNGPSPVTLFRDRTLECVSSTGLRKLCPYILPTILLHIEAEFMSSSDSKIDTWIISSTAVRIALRFGLHHEPLAEEGISPFNAEMRRRLWLGIVQSDIMLSFQVGLPAMIPWRQVDVRLPRNLRDDDLDENSSDLPPSRHMREATNISFFLAKQPLLECFARIASHSQEPYPRDEEVAVLQQNLDRAREGLPPIYRIRPINEAVTEPSFLVMQRYAIDQIYQTAVCVLHRKHLSRASSIPEWSQSRLLCIDSALTLLSYQAIKDEESRPAGRFAGNKIMMNSLDQNSFLLAAMLICLDLKQRGSLCLESSDLLLWNQERGDEMKRALETSMKIWDSKKNVSSEASRASKILSRILRSLLDDKIDFPVVEMGIGEPEHLSEVLASSEEFDWVGARDPAILAMKAHSIAVGIRQYVS
ncbi:hypothetical protein N7510_004770 [Penicillium lagena]|uniref:uncharacterized protein n=1 Tax=Penicillium lagena TaxID=94218 RepID=UPI0025404D34|nr:uncharacterized protein N7510_004770 [Penicillium lagena]KAJ5620786.1 hypothetical protein N7510_004770 [Penicillium lagena]